MNRHKTVHYATTHNYYICYRGRRTSPLFPTFKEAVRYRKRMAVTKEQRKFAKIHVDVISSKEILNVRWNADVSDYHF